MVSELDPTTRSNCNDSYNARGIGASSISEESNSSSIVTGEEAYGEINLELSISLPSSNLKISTNEMKKQQEEVQYQNFMACMPISTNATAIVANDFHGFYKPFSLS